MSTDKGRSEKDIEEEIVYDEEDLTASDKIKKIREKLDKCVAEKQEYLDGWQRAQADLVNAKKRIETEKKEFATYATQNFVLELLPILDSFDMAFKDQDAWNKAPDSWRKGVEYIHTQFTTTLGNHGVYAIRPLGDLFNEKEHESIESVLVDDPKDDHKIIEVVMAGYKFGEKIIRPAKVKVGTVDK